jgi:DNA gyrase subunit B
MKNSKEIVVLSEKDHIRLRPTIYIGSVKPTDEKVPIIRNGSIFVESRSISVGMYKLLDEAVSNAIDEAKRMNGKMKSITVSINSSENSVRVRDTGNGFYNGIKKNKISGVSNIETAVSMLRSGSNFDNEESEVSVIGTNGVGIAVTNVCSKFFKVVTVNDTHYYEQEWDDYNRKAPIIRDKKSSDPKGTEVYFKPLDSIFEKSRWDKEVLISIMTIKRYSMLADPLCGSTELILNWDGVNLDLKQTFYPKDSFIAKTQIGTLMIWRSFDGSGSISSVNGALCSGIHQRIINDKINIELEDTLGHHFYETFLVLNLSPKLVKFADQNKTKYVTPRLEVEPTINKHFASKIQQFFGSKLFADIKKLVDDRRKDLEIKKIRSEKKKVKIKFSEKYFPSTKSLGKNLFLVEGLSASGSILQKRNPAEDGVYALKGKIKNCRSIGDLSDNREILELMNILNLDPEGPTGKCPYEKIVIATDQDPDGNHISALIINLFYRWFPWMIKEGRLGMLNTPLVSAGTGSKKEYFYGVEEFRKVSSKRKLVNIRYLKGLGSLSLEDWENVMKDKKIVNILNDKTASQFLEMAFGRSAEERKIWLSQNY